MKQNPKIKCLFCQNGLEFDNFNTTLVCRKDTTVNLSSSSKAVWVYTGYMDAKIYNFVNSSGQLTIYQSSDIINNYTIVRDGYLGNIICRLDYAIDPPTTEEKLKRIFVTLKNYQ